MYEMISLCFYIIHLKRSFCSTHFSDSLLHQRVIKLLPIITRPKFHAQVLPVLSVFLQQLGLVDKIGVIQRLSLSLLHREVCSAEKSATQDENPCRNNRYFFLQLLSLQKHIVQPEHGSNRFSFSCAGTQHSIYL